MLGMAERKTCMRDVMNYESLTIQLVDVYKVSKRLRENSWGMENLAAQCLYK